MQYNDNYYGAPQQARQENVQLFDEHFNAHERSVGFSEHQGACPNDYNSYL